MGENEQGGMLQTVVVVGIIALIAIVITVGVVGLKVSMNKNTDNAVSAIVKENGQQTVGRNLLLDSQTQTNTGAWFSSNGAWTKERGTYLGSRINSTNIIWNNVRYRYKDLLDRGVINTTDDFTYSVYFRVVGEDPAGMSYAIVYFLSETTTKNWNVPVQITSLKEGQWTRLVTTFKFKDLEYDSSRDYQRSIRVEVSAPPKAPGAHYEYAAPKLEKGTVATDYDPALEN